MANARKDAVDKSVIVTDGFRFADITSYRDPDFIPGAVKYGDIPGLLTSAASSSVWVVGENPASLEAAQSEFNDHGGSLRVSQEKEKIDPALEWLLAE